MGGGSILNRALEASLREHLQTFPVVVVTGARQTGKSTLARELAGEGRTYLTLDDLDARDQAEREPHVLLNRAPVLTIDEVQRAPDLLLEIKRAVDRDRQPGRFLLTGSANLLLMKGVADSLSGRATYLRLGPLTASERAGFGRAGRWDVFFDEPHTRWLDAVGRQAVDVETAWVDLARAGGYPVPAYHLDSDDARAAWFDGYVTTYLERDLRDFAAVSNLADFRRLMRAAALRVGNLLNQSDLARDVGLPPTTAQRYLSLMETSFQLERVEAFSVNRTKRLTKSPKIFWGDTGMALHLAGENEPRGAHFEGLVLNDLLTWSATRPGAPQILYWRTSKGAEVDFVVEWRGRVLPIEVKSGSRVRSADVRHLRTFLDDYRDLASAGLVLYDGDEIYWVGESVLAVPWRSVM
jgi:predicted AAA+ superfamily ATPase